MTSPTDLTVTGPDPAAGVPGAARALLDVRDLRVRFRLGQRVLDVTRGVTFDVRAGETVALVGESGSGKSVTARAILGLLERNASVAAGEIRFAGENLLAAPERRLRDLRGGEIALILQDAMTSLNPSHSIGRQVAEPLRLHRGYSRARAWAHAVELLDRVGIVRPDEVAHRYPHQLSGGMRQRAVIAGALACQPRLLIADEPTTALDVTIQAQVLALMGELAREQGTALLLITHDLGIVADVAERIVVLYAGEVLETGTADDVLDAPRHPYTIGLLESVPARARPGEPLPAIEGQIPEPDRVPAGCVFHPRCPRAIESCRTDHPALAAVAGRTLTLLAPGEEPVPHLAACPVPVPVPSAAAPVTVRDRPAAVAPAGATVENRPLLAVRDLTKVFTTRSAFGRGRLDTKALDGVSFTIAAGRTLGLVGESGSGKSSTARVIARLLEPTSGSVELDGENLLALSGETLRRRRTDLQVVFQDALGSLDPRRTVGASVAEPLRAFERKVTRERVTELLEQVGLTGEFAGRAPHELSGGQRQRVAIARALALRPRLLICDEPVASLDVSVQAQVINLLERLQAELGLTYLFISHDLALVRHLSDDIAVMHHGRIVEQGPAAEIYDNPREDYTRALVAAEPGRLRFHRRAASA